MSEREMFFEAIDNLIEKQKEEVQRYEFMKMALMKALPLKVKYKEGEPYCPECGNRFFDDEKNQIGKCNYCWYCGQKLDYE